MKKYILSIAILFVLVLASSIFLPYLFKDKIIEAVRTEANKSLKVELNFNPNIGINVFKSFPNLNISFKDLLKYFFSLFSFPFSLLIKCVNKYYSKTLEQKVP